MNEEKYSVGQVVFVISKSDNKVVPIQVVEEVNRVTLDGVQRTYNVQIGPKGAKPVAEVTKIPGLIFRTVEEVRNYMMQNASSAVENLIKVARTSAVKWYGKKEEAPQESLLDETWGTVHVDEESSDGSQVDQAVGSDFVEVALPDGRITKVKANIKIAAPH
jgi:hypothetical protein